MNSETNNTTDDNVLVTKEDMDRICEGFLESIKRFDGEIEDAESVTNPEYKKAILDMNLASKMVFQEIHGLLISCRDTGNIPKNIQKLRSIVERGYDNVVAQLKNKAAEYCGLSKFEAEFLEDLEKNRNIPENSLITSVLDVCKDAIAALKNSWQLRQSDSRDNGNPAKGL